MIRLGIDTGGTYTDAVIVDVDDMRVLAKAKALTTKDDLTRGIERALDALPCDLLNLVEHVALSTTLATNACVEGKGGRARLIIVGTDDALLRRVDAQGAFGIPYSDVLALKYEGSYDGSDVVIPDWEALYRENPAFFEEADSFGIASLYALNNGAAVEKSGAAFLRERFGKFVVEATTVATELNVIARGATALLNARLVPVIGDFLDAIDEVFAQRGLSAPVSIVRSDGTLMSEELARTRPVETILSGPAASVNGARALAGAPECLIVDIGGTTSDVAIVHGSRPNRTDGIRIGGWKTQIAGVEIDTIALGGDTVVHYTKDGRLELGTRRVTPLCIAARRWPQVIDELERYLADCREDFNARYEALYLLRDPGDVARFSRPEQQLVELLREGPVALFDELMVAIVGLKPQRLEDEGIVMRCGFTPTDAMHLKGDFDEYDAEASLLGARCILKSYKGEEAADDDDAIDAFADEVYALAQFRLFRQMIGAFAKDRYWPDDAGELDAQMDAVVQGVWERRDGAGPSWFNVDFDVASELVGVGAPTHVLLGEAARAMGASFTVPANAEVANAVGAAISRVTVEQRVSVNPLRGSDGVIVGYQVRGRDEAVVFKQLEDALERARCVAREQARAEARLRGAEEGLECAIDEKRRVFTYTGNTEIVAEWTVTARIGDEMAASD